MVDELKKKIVLVEDDPFLIKVLSAKFAGSNFNIIIVKDGEEVLNVVKEEMPQLILLDVMLPHKSGFEILEEIKKDAKLKDIPVLILTNLGQEEEVARGRQLGANEYLVKTEIGLDEIVKKASEYLK